MNTGTEARSNLIRAWQGALLFAALVLLLLVWVQVEHARLLREQGTMFRWLYQTFPWEPTVILLPCAAISSPFGYWIGKRRVVGTWLQFMASALRVGLGWSLTMLALVDLYLLLTKPGTRIGPMHLWNGIWMFCSFFIPSCLVMANGLRYLALGVGAGTNQGVAQENGTVSLTPKLD